MKNPTKKQVQKVIDTLTKVLPAARKLDRKEGSIGMLISHVDHSCGSPMCHGGWYAVAKKKGLDYQTGSELIAKDLGFANQFDLRYWADGNEEIWDNNNGYYMFCDCTAFNYRNNLTLGKIITHWKGVQKRLIK